MFCEFILINSNAYVCFLFSVFSGFWCVVGEAGWFLGLRARCVAVVLVAVLCVCKYSLLPC